jgi:hypothetical protein
MSNISAQLSDSDDDEYVCEKYLDDELDYIYNLHNNLKSRFPYFISNMDTFTNFLLNTTPYHNIPINESRLNFFESEYDTELAVTFKEINRRYYINKRAWLEYCYLYNN